MVKAGSESAVRWMPVCDFPCVHCQVWRLRSDDDFEVTVEGDFYVRQTTRTLSIGFSGVLAISAHEDMIGMSMIAKSTVIPTIGEASQAVYRWPALQIENSQWLASIRGPTEKCSHFALFSLTCTVEVIAKHAEASWRDCGLSAN